MSGKRRRERGVVAVTAALGLFVLLGIAALAVDLGMLIAARTQLETAADAAALAAAKELAFGARDHALRRAEEYAHHNLVLGEPVVLRPGNRNAPEDVVLGFYDLATHTFRPEDLLPNAVEVTTRRTQNRATAVPTFFAAVFGRREVNVSAHSIAIGFPREIVPAIDASGSMGEDANCNGTPGNPAIVPAREAAAEFIRDISFSTLPEHAGMLSFSRHAVVRAPIKGLHDAGQPDDLIRRTLRIEASPCGAEGATNTGEAIQRAIRMFEEASPGPGTSGFSQRLIILLSDGLANRDAFDNDYYPYDQFRDGNPAWRYAVDSAAEARELNITVHTIQLGNLDRGPQERQMREIAAAGGGMYLFAPTTEQLDEMFETLARHVQVALVD